MCMRGGGVVAGVGVGGGGRGGVVAASQRDIYNVIDLVGISREALAAVLEYSNAQTQQPWSVSEQL